MNNVELKAKIHSAAYTVLKEKNFVSPVDVLISLGVLSSKDYENWRFGRAPYLERVCQVSLSKMSFIMKEFRAYARQNNLKPSRTAYHQWGVNGRKIPLRFSKSGNSSIEEAYATHFVDTSRAGKKEEGNDER